MEFHVNYLAVVLATFSSMVIGSVWYGPLLGKLWMKENKFTSDDIKKAGPVWRIFATSAAMYLIASFGLSMYLGKDPSVSMGAFAGFATAFFWIGTSKFNTAMYESTSKKLWLIHFGYDVLVYTIMGVIIGAIQ